MVLIYSTPTCVYCKIAKTWFNAHNIEYTEVDVSSNEEALSELITKTGQKGVPVIDIDGEIWVGWQPSEMKRVFNV